MSKYIMGLLLLCVGAVFAQSGWVRQTSPAQANLAAVDLINAQMAVVVGDARTILRTTDGGATWSSVNAGTGISLNAVSFANDSAGVATGLDGQILWSQNAGASWAVIQEGWSSDYHAAQQLTPSVGYVMGGNAIFTSFGSRTTDGWQSHQDFAFYVQHDSSGNEGAVYGVHFFNADTGCAAVAVWDGHGAVCRTTDGGQNWITTAWLANCARAMDFPTPTIGYVCGDYGSFVRSSNAGATWTEYNTELAITFWGLKFVSADTGWVVGDGGAIYRTNSGGEAAQPQFSGVTTTLRSVDFLDANTGYVVGDSGAILKTTTGGEIVNQPPGAFIRVAPRDDSTCLYQRPGEVTFRWTTAHDPDGDAVSYHVYVNVWDSHFAFATMDTTLSDSLHNAWADPYMPVTWWVMATDGHDSTAASNGQGHFTILMPDATHGVASPLPKEYLLSAYPNPFNPTTTISISLPQPSEVSLSVFSIEGRRVFEKRFGVMSAGEHRIEFDGSKLPSGIYISRLQTPRAQISRKLVLMK